MGDMTMQDDGKRRNDRKLVHCSSCHGRGKVITGYNILGKQNVSKCTECKGKGKVPA